MTPSSHLLKLLLPAVFALAAAPAHAQMIPLYDGRSIFAHAEFGTVSAGPTTLSPAAPFSAFDEFIDLLAEYPPPSPPNPSGLSEATAYQNSQFFPFGIFASGKSSGGWQGEANSFYAAYSLADFRFRVDTCITWSLDATMEPGDLSATGFIELRAAGAPEPYFHSTDGHQEPTGRLSPGTYDITGASSIGSGIFPSPGVPDGAAPAGSPEPFIQGPTYAIAFLCNVCATTLIAHQPGDTTLLPGNPLALRVLPTPPSCGLTYQWRRNLVPLPASPQYGGETTNTLTIFNAGVADTGYYDVVLTDCGIVEPSRMVHVTLGGVTEVEPWRGPREFALEHAAPNPSSGTTAFRYAAARSIMLTGAIHDVSGRIVRALEPRRVEGGGVLTWDGRDAAGQLVAPGVYFLRVRADAESHVQRIVRLR